MSEDTTATIDGGKVVEDLAAGLPDVAKISTFPELLDGLHERGLCLELTDHFALAKAIEDSREALRERGITFNRYRRNGAIRLTCNRREVSRH